MKTTAPNSPSERAKLSVTPVIKAGRIAGNTTLRKIVKDEAPSVAAACSYCGSRSSSTGCTVRTTNGIEVNDIASATPQIV